MKGFIFDLDGVIVSTDGLHYLAWKKMADKEGIYFDEEINNRLRGVSRMASLEIVLERASRAYSEEEKVALATYKNDVYRELLKSLTPEDILPGVTAVLNGLRSRGYKLAIGSSSKNAKFILKQLGLEGYFDAISDGTNITRSKPDPQVFQMAAQFLNLRPEECLVVEDAVAGIDAAKDGGFAAAGLGEAAEYGRTDHPLNTFGDLCGIL